SFVPSPSEPSFLMVLSSKPQSSSACRPPWPRSGGARRTAPGVREKRGAGAGCATFFMLMKLFLNTLCVSHLASDHDSTGAKQASEPSNTLHHCARVFDLNVFANSLCICGQRLRLCWLRSFSLSFCSSSR